MTEVEAWRAGVCPGCGVALDTIRVWRSRAVELGIAPSVHYPAGVNVTSNKSSRGIGSVTGWTKDEPYVTVGGESVAATATNTALRCRYDDDYLSAWVHRMRHLGLAEPARLGRHHD